MIIMARGLIRVAQCTAAMLIAKNAATRATPSTLPSSPFAPPSTVLSTIMISAAPAVTTAERRAIGP